MPDRPAPLLFQPLPAPARGRGERRWERFAGVGLLLLLALAAGVRPGSLRQVGSALVMSAVAESATAASDPSWAARAWNQLRRYRTEDPKYQGALAAQLFSSYHDAKLNDAAEALVTELDRAGQLTQGDPRVSYYLGAVLLSAGEPRKAVVLLEAGLRRSPAMDALGFQLRNTLAAAYEMLGRNDAAEQLYLGLLESFPKDPTPYNNLAYHYAERGVHLAQAEQLSRRALDLQRRQRLASLSFWSKAQRLTDATYLDTLGWVLYQQGQLDASEKLLREAVGLSEAAPSAEILYHLGKVYYDRGSDDQAERLVDQALALEPAYEPAIRLKQILRGNTHEMGPIT